MRHSDAQNAVMNMNATTLHHFSKKNGFWRMNNTKRVHCFAQRTRNSCIIEERHHKHPARPATVAAFRPWQGSTSVTAVRWCHG